MTRTLRTFLLGIFLTWSIAGLAAPPIWDDNFDAANDTGLQEDDDQILLTLSFMFPFDGTDYDTVAIGTNGGITLGVGGVFAGDEYIDYDIWDDAYFESDFTDLGNPAILPFNTDLDNGDGPVGTIHFEDYGDRAVITWNGVATHENDLQAFITFQATLADDGTITFGYDGITGDLVLDVDQGIVVGVSNGAGAAVPGSSDLSDGVNADVDSPTNYEIWCYDEDFVVGGDCYISDGTRPDNYAFDLDQTNVIFTPNATGGWDISSEADAGPPPPLVGGPVQGEYGGCTVGVSDGRIDPTLPLLVLISIVALWSRRKQEA